jgi:hypothetical protein
MLFRWGPRRPDQVQPSPRVAAAVAPDQAPVPTKALPKFVTSLVARESPVLLDLGPVVGPNVTFFGERLGCKIFVEDLYGDRERHVREQKLAEFPAFLETRLAHPDVSVDGILCWDLFDYLDRPAAQVLARQLLRVLRRGGALFGLFGTAETTVAHYTKYVIVGERALRHRTYPATPSRNRALLNRDIIKMFDGLLVSDLFLLQSNTREILFRKTK